MTPKISAPVIITPPKKSSWEKEWDRIRGFKEPDPTPYVYVPRGVMGLSREAERGVEGLSSLRQEEHQLAQGHDTWQPREVANTAPSETSTLNRIRW